MGGYQLPMKLLDQPHPDVANPLPDRATSLMAFAYRGEEALAEDLLARGAEPDARDADGYTALMYAANQGHHGCVRSLLAHGASPNAADEQVSTPQGVPPTTPAVRCSVSETSPGARGPCRQVQLGVLKTRSHCSPGALKDRLSRLAGSVTITVKPPDAAVPWLMRSMLRNTESPEMTSAGSAVMFAKVMSARRGFATAGPSGSAPALASSSPARTSSTPI